MRLVKNALLKVGDVVMQGTITSKDMLDEFVLVAFDYMDEIWLDPEGTSPVYEEKDSVWKRLKDMRERGSLG